MRPVFVLAASLAAMIACSEASSASSLSLSADSLSVTGCLYNGPVGGGAVGLYCAGDIHGMLTFPSGNGTYQISIVARGDLVSGMFPNAQISIDGSVVGNISVTTSSFSTFTLDKVAASAGSHTLRIA